MAKTCASNSDPEPQQCQALQQIVPKYRIMSMLSLTQQPGLQRKTRSAFAGGAAMLLFLFQLMPQGYTNAQQPDLPDPAMDENAYVEAVEAWRAQGDEDYRTEGQSPFKTKKARKRFKGRSWFPVDPNARVEAEVLRFWLPDTIPFPTSAGTIKPYIRWAELVFEYGGQEYSLVAYRSVRNLHHPEYGELLFVPFTDLSSGVSTYGGGRYLDPPMPAESEGAAWGDASWEDDTVILDFNLAYNPYCAVADGWFCPIPPAENALLVAVRAGERMPEQDGNAKKR
jgi:uncharacterized protein (DUF1684 family)